jgi:hypothetical protein
MTQQGRNMKECVTIDDKTLCAFVGDQCFCTTVNS